MLNTGGWNNTKSVITRNRNDSALASVDHSPLNCGTLQSFWVTWDGGEIRVGNGLTTGQAEFMAFNDSDPFPADYLSVATGQNVTGYWIFHSGKYELFIDQLLI